MMMGVMGDMSMLSFVPMGCSAVERQDNLVEWVNSWWSSGKAKWLGPEGWYDGANRQGSCVWCPPHALAHVALEQLCKCQLKRPDTVESMWSVPHIMTP
jgi:hypothetical protein